MKRILFLFTILASVSCTAQKPVVIGISSARTSSGSVKLQSTYTEAIHKAGAVALVIPTISTREQADAILSTLDGILFSGGEDVNPAWYGESVYNETVYMDPVRDRSDSLLARAALAYGKPVLGICRGGQLMNVIMGGSMYQDLPSQTGTAVTHGGGASHRIGVEKGSVLAELFGSDSLTVNSFHHQAVKDPAPGVIVTARAADGVIEAYENGMVWSVQFHPEKLLHNGDEAWLAFFKAFADRCSGKRK
jgi:putative glutamine amidotransferase